MLGVYDDLAVIALMISWRFDYKVFVPRYYRREDSNCIIIYVEIIYLCYICAETTFFVETTFM